MRTRIRVLDLITVVLSAALVIVVVAVVVVADATSKNNHPHNASPSKTINININTSNSNSNSNATINSETIVPATKKRDKVDNNGSSPAKKKKKGIKPKKQQPRTSSRIQSSSRVSSQASTSLRRIKREYKDAVDMGIAYDWVNQRLIKRKTKTKKVVDTGSQTIMCLGPITSNLRHWHFSFRGAGEGVYSKGVYHGLIILPKDYPLMPPRVQMWTRSGRFIPFKDICLSASSYHPESWTPRWSIQGIVNALRLHMLNPPNEIGGIQSTHEESTKLARLSLAWKQTWVEGGSSKRTKITVDHQLLIQEGVLGLGEKSDNGEKEGSREKSDDEEEKTVTGEIIPVSTEDESDSDSDQGVVVEKEDGATRDSIINNSNNNSDPNDNSIRFSARFSFSMTTVTSLFQLICLYVIVILFLNR